LIRSANAAIEIDVFVASVTDEAATKQIAEKVAAWDVLVLNAAYISAPFKIADVPLDEFWKAYEVCTELCPLSISSFQHPRLNVLEMADAVPRQT